MKFRSISGRLIFWFLSVNFLLLSTVMTIIYIQRVRYIKSDTFSRLTAIRELKVEELNNWLAERRENIKAISEIYRIKNSEVLFGKKNLDENEKKIFLSIRILLKQYVDNYNAFECLSVVNASNGTIEISSDRNLEGLNISEEDYFMETLKKKGLHIKDIHLSKSTKLPAMIMSMPVYNLTDKRIIAVISGRLNLENSLYPLLINRTGLGETGETLLVNKSCIAISKLRWYDYGPCRLKITGTPGLMASSGKTGIIESLDYRGVPVLGAYTFIPDMSWGFVAKQDLSELYRPINNMFVNFLVILIIAFVALFFIAMFIAKTFSEPLREMAEVARRIQKGDLSARNRIKRVDELGYLAETFNDMAEDLMVRISVRKSVSELMEAMLKTYNLKEFVSSLLEKLLEITSSHTCVFYVQRGDSCEPFFAIGLDKNRLPSFNIETLDGQFGEVFLKGNISHIKNIPSDTVFTFKTITGTAIMREIISIPIISDGRIMALISMGTLAAFSKESLDVINFMWPVINTGFSVVMAHEEIKNITEELKMKNTELESQSEELLWQSKALHRQNMELEMQNRQIEGANRMKSEFVSNMSHELRTPLNSVIGLSRVLLMQTKDKLSEEERSYLEVIQRNGKSLLSLINDILDLSRIEAGKMELNIKSFSLRDILENICENLAILASEKALVMKIDLPDNLSSVESDEGAVYKIFQNIISNAIKFTDKGSVTITGEEKNDTIYIHVIDTGIGIEQNALSYIFEEFRQVDGTTSRRHEGTGLGLAIAYKTVKQLNGNIYVESIPEKGSTFTVMFPVKWEDKIINEDNITHDMPDFSSSDIACRQKIGKHILLVEDNIGAIVEIRTVLEKEGFRVSVSDGGQEAIDYIKHTIPDGIILDLMMPDVDGFEVLNELRNKPDTASIPVLILTAKDLTSEDLMKLKNNNIQQLIRKGDINRNELLEKVKSLTAGQEIKKREPYEKTSRKDSYEKLLMLIVEDNPDNMVTIKAMLGNKYTLIGASSGEEGLLKAMSEKPDLICLDMALPGMDGFSVIEKLKKDEMLKNIPVIAITSRAMTGDREVMLAAGCKDYLSKPLEQETLLKKIEEWI